MLQGSHNLPCRLLTAQAATCLRSFWKCFAACCEKVTVTLTMELVSMWTRWHGRCKGTCASQTPSAMQDITGPFQAVPEQTLNEDEQTGIEDEPEAASPWEAKPERPQATEQRDQGALVIYQPPLQGISSAKAKAAGEEPPPPLYHPALQLSA